MNFPIYAEWPVQLARCVEVSPETSANREEIVAGMLYELTVHGFSPEEQDENFKELKDPYSTMLPSNPYIVPLQNIEQKLHDNNCRYPEDKGTKLYTWKTKEDLFWKTRRNGPKRHRERRQSLRQEQLEKLASNWDTIHRFTTKYNNTDLHRYNPEYNSAIHRESIILYCDKGFFLSDFGPESKFLGTKKPQNTLIFCGLS